ncbi:MAG: hypothetical protein PW786_15600 [Arachidicoccus sp.]|nr:hypothetical protein [Arachidicoccus sp.]
MILNFNPSEKGINFNILIFVIYSTLALLKKTVSILFLCLYAFTTSGAYISMHYCGSMLSYVSVNIKGDDNFNNCCGKNIEIYRKGCCSTKIIRPHVSNDRQLFSGDYNLQFVLQDLISLTSNHFYTDFFSVDERKKIVFYTNAPPSSWRKIPLYKLHHRFIYYG